MRWWLLIVMWRAPMGSSGRVLWRPVLGLLVGWGVEAWRKAN